MPSGSNTNNWRRSLAGTCVARYFTPCLLKLAIEFVVVVGRERDVVDTAAAMALARSVLETAGFHVARLARDVHHRHVTDVDPQSLEVERRTRTRAQPQHVAVECAGLLQVLGEDHVVLHLGDGHGD